jgi:hypothetical protein
VAMMKPSSYLEHRGVFYFLFMCMSRRRHVGRACPAVCSHVGAAAPRTDKLFEADLGSTAHETAGDVARQIGSHDPRFVRRRMYPFELSFTGRRGDLVY